MAAYWRDLEVTQTLLAHESDVNAKSNSDEPLFHKTLSWKHLETAKVVLEYATNANTRDRDGKIPFDLADYNTCEAIKQYLGKPQDNRNERIESLNS